MATLMVLVLALVLRRTAALLEVEMDGRTQRVFLNGNITIICRIPGFQQLDIRIMGVVWYRKSPMNDTEVKVLELVGHDQKAFRSGAVVSPRNLMMGDASLQLPGVQLREAGEYRCEVVVTPEKAQGTVWLQVIAYPVSSLYQDPATVKNNEDKHFLCTSSWFYPEDINITWYKRTQEDHQYEQISEGISTDSAVKNEDGTFNITSHLRPKSPLQGSVTVFQCVVVHISSPTSQSYNLTLDAIESQKSTSSWIVAVTVCFGGIGVLIGVLFLCLWKWCSHRRRQSTFVNETY
ncbi:natural cytotoxicity triggering receptor 3 ligand 1 isoform 2-T2 [Hipposideros larvatus]